MIPKKLLLTREWFVKGMCHGQFWGKPCLSEQGIVSCEVTLEVSGHMYPGSGLQTEIECSYFGSNSNPAPPPPSL